VLRLLSASSRCDVHGRYIRPFLLSRVGYFAPTPDRGARGDRQCALERPPPPHQL